MRKQDLKITVETTCERCEKPLRAEKEVPQADFGEGSFGSVAHFRIYPGDLGLEVIYDASTGLVVCGGCKKEYDELKDFLWRNKNKTLKKFMKSESK